MIPLLTEPKGILLDLDNTLYDYRSCHLAGVSSAGRYFRERLGIGFYDFINAYEHSRSEINAELKGLASAHNRLLYFQRAVERLNIGVRPELMLNLHSIYWESFIERIEVFENVFDFFKECRERAVRIALVTDLTADVQLRKISKMGIEKYIDAVITSEEAGAEKPNLAIFLLALKKLGLLPQDVWVIGDNLKKDIVGGNLLGATTIQFVHDGVETASQNELERPARAVRSFGELNSILSGDKTGEAYG